MFLQGSDHPLAYLLLEGKTPSARIHDTSDRSYPDQMPLRRKRDGCLSGRLNEVMRAGGNDGEAAHGDKLRSAVEDVAREEVVDIHGIALKEILGVGPRDARAGAQELRLPLWVAPEGPQESLDCTLRGGLVHGPKASLR